jgi:DNA-binding GntR family transcriptional regulator
VVPTETRHSGERVSTKKRAGNTASLIYERLRADINGGKLAPGSPLSQLAIATAHGTSRGPVREALRRLQQDQLVIARENKRFNVAPFDLADLETVLSLHLVNVSLGIQVSVPRLKKDEIAVLRRCVKNMDEAATDRDEAAWQRAYREFALTIICHAGRRVVSLVEGLIDNIERYRRGILANAPTVSPRGPAFQHIVDAAAAHDGERAARLAREFMSRMSMLILAGAAPEYDACRLRSYISAMADRKD